ncbi:arabinan endo-1,5-alpha-L-arabinosidase [uncultured Bacteroides sp.]|uniref:arabinan endo-1,5-alpha-L-arabinosidase n=1 Tax=uncultured Bacteroides sp. TaxID=162156 RepID=UPI002AA85DFB|nr:arabinan endo-1,5-alpha-L-arabinosidase [uncultured Bacteroides sp.]
MRRPYLFAMICVATLLSCSKPSLFKISSSPNPWVDDYSSFSGMEHYRSWGTYNVHDPACKKFGDYYYMYSTDAIYAKRMERTKERQAPPGYIQVRRSKDLVHWEFVGWAFPEIPQEAVEWVRSNADGRGATNIWAPYIIKYKSIYRLYYCVSAFGRKASYIGLAESDSPEGPWLQRGCVLKTNDDTPMNAIDPSVIADPDTGKWWMCYGSFFGGLYCVQLNPATGLVKEAADRGHLIARRANYRKDNLEAPEIVYNPELKKYFLFVSYDPLMTTYNIRVGRSDSPEGPFVDYTGQVLADTTNNFPILTAPYRFDHHPGWAGTGHCGVYREENGCFFMFHQARLSPENQLMVLHVRQVFFNADGWPVVSPERYAASLTHKFQHADLVGKWEIIRIKEPQHERNLEAGQIQQGDVRLKENEQNLSSHYYLKKDGTVSDKGSWIFNSDKQLLEIKLGDEVVKNLIIFAGHDWENATETILFTGLDSTGRSVWGKLVK